MEGVIWIRFCSHNLGAAGEVEIEDGSLRGRSFLYGRIIGMAMEC